jgi:RNA polymerase sigma-70 factor (ECF subfamily)
MADEIAKLVQSATSGDAHAVEDLLARYLPELRGYLQRNAGALIAGKESSSDLAQSVCRDMLERLGTERFVYRGEAEVKQWLYNAALFKIRARQRFYLAARRDAGREVGILDASTGSSAPDLEPSAAQHGPGSAAELREDVERLRAALAHLPENYRDVLLLSNVDGLSHKQIADKLGISEANSRVLLSRALARLATLGVKLGLS